MWSVLWSVLKKKWAESGQKVGRCQKLVEICKEK
nr:MAG TPA: hypothetical protein [Caudoviricetes sp.]